MMGLEAAAGHSRRGRSPIALDMVFAFSLRIGSAGASYLGAVLLGRWLAPTDFGQFSSTIAILMILASVLSFGLPMTVLRFTGEYTGKGMVNEAHGLILASLRVAWVSSAAISVLLCGVLWVWLQQDGAAWSQSYLLPGLLLLPPFVAVEFQGAVLRSNGAFFWALSPRDLIWRLCIIGVGFWASASFVPGQQFGRFMLVSAGLLWLLAGLQSVLMFQCIPSLVATATPKFQLRLWFSVARPIWITNVAGVVTANLDVVLIGLLLPVESSGLYFAATRTASLSSFTLNAINLVFGPQLPLAYFREDHAEVQRLLRISVILAVVPAVLTAFVCLMFGKQILGMFGPDFATMHGELVLLAMAQLANGATGSAELMLNMTGHERKSALVSLAIIAVSLIAIPVTAWIGGTLAVAASVSAIITIHNVVLWRIARTATGFDTSFLCLTGKRP